MVAVFYGCQQWIERYGMDAALLVGDALEQYRRQPVKLKGRKGYWVCYGIRECRKNTGLSPFRQRQALDAMERDGVLLKVNVGAPQKRHLQFVIGLIDSL